jgi:DNA-binding transcriptional LysR family regulator
MVLVCSPKHPLAWREQVGVEELDGCDLISFDPELKIRRELDRVLASHDVEMRVVMEFDNIETIKRAIEIDAGVGLLPEPTIVKEVQSGSLVARRIQGLTLSRPVGIIVRAGKELGRIATLFIELLRAQPADRFFETIAKPESAFSGGSSQGEPADRHKSPRAIHPASA